MRRSRRSRFERPKAAVDMNSLIDLTFLLLVVFIVTLPALEQSVQIILPTDKVEERKKEEQKTTFITVDSAGLLFNGNTPMTHESLKALFEQKVLEDAENFTVVIRGDVRASYGDVYAVFKVARECNVKHLSLAVADK